MTSSRWTGLLRIGAGTGGGGAAAAEVMPQHEPVPPSRPVGIIGGGGGAVRIRLAQREPGVSAFASHRSRVAQRGCVDEHKLVVAFWKAIHSGGRTLYGHTCTDLQSFWAACDRDGTESIQAERLSDAMVRLGLGLTKVQAKAMADKIAVGASGMCNYGELVSWVRSHRKTRTKSAKGTDTEKVTGCGWGAAAASAAEAIQLDHSTHLYKTSTRNDVTATIAKNRTFVSCPGTFGTSARPDPAHLAPWNDDGEQTDEPHAFLRRQTAVKLPLRSSKIIRPPKASQLAAAIELHERGYKQRAAAHKQALAARLECENKSAIDARQPQGENSRRRMNSAKEKRDHRLAKQFKLGSIVTSEWQKVEAAIETQVERREKPEKVMQRKQKRRVGRVDAAKRIQAWYRGVSARRLVLQELKPAAQKRQQRLAVQDRRRLEACADVVDALITKLESHQLAEQRALASYLKQLQQQNTELEAAATTFMDPTVSESKRQQARCFFADAVEAEGIPQKQARWDKYKAWVKIARERETADLEASDRCQKQDMDSASGQRNVLPPAFSRPYSALARAQAAAASRLGFTAQSWPRLPRKAAANKVPVHI